MTTDAPQTNEHKIDGKPEVRFLAENQSVKPQVVHCTFVMGPHGTYAAQFINCLLSAGGDQVPIRDQVKDLAAYACDLADCFLSECARRGWTAPMPSIDEVIETRGSAGFGATFPSGERPDPAR